MQISCIPRRAYFDILSLILSLFSSFLLDYKITENQQNIQVFKKYYFAFKAYVKDVKINLKNYLVISSYLSIVEFDQVAYKKSL